SHLATAKRLGLASGVDGAKFMPEASIQREDMFVLLHRILSHLDESPENRAVKALDDFADVDLISDYALDAARRFVAAGVVEGDGNRLSPLDPVTRSQAVKLLYNLL